MHYKAREYLALAGRTYQNLAQFFVSNKAIITVQNQDDGSFGYAVLSARSPFALTDHANRPGHFIQLFLQFGLHDFAYPVAIEDIPAIEDMLGVSINVFSFFDDEGKARHPL